MDISRSFSFVFEDKQWFSKVLIGGLMTLASFTIVMAPFMVGYYIRLVSNIASGKGKTLPNWENWGDLYKKGLYAAAIGLIYGIALGILSFVMKFLPFFKNFTWLLNLVFSFYFPVAIVFYAAMDNFSYAFEFEKILKFTANNIVHLLVIWLLGIVLMLISLSGLILLVIGVFFTAFYSLAVRAHLYADLYRTSKTN